MQDVARSVLVTGGNRGIGRAIAQAFRDLGDDVAITYRSGEPPEGFLAVRCDVTSPEDVDRAGRTLRHLDWFEMTQVRGQIKDGQVEHFQVGLKVGFRLEDD